MSGDALAPVARSTSRAGEHRLGLRVVEVVARVEQPEHGAAEEAGGEHDDERAPAGSAGAGGGSGRRGGRASSAVLAASRPRASVCGSTQQAAHSSLGASTSRFSAAITFSSIPLAKNDHSCAGSAPVASADLAHEVGVALAHPRLDLGIGGGGVALHLEQQRRAVGEQVGVGLPHRRHALLERQRRAPPRRTSRRCARASPRGRRGRARAWCGRAGTGRAARSRPPSRRRRSTCRCSPSARSARSRSR